MTKYLLMILFFTANCIVADSGLMAQTTKPDTLRNDTIITAEWPVWLSDGI